MKIRFFNTPISLKNRTRLKNFLLTVIKKRNKHITYVNIIFCNDNQLQDINMKFLNHKSLTDIITFNYAQNRHKDIEAELYISEERIRYNYKIYNTTFKEELHRVIFHGILHLCGFNDKTDSEKQAMRKEENACLALYNKIK